MRFRVLPLCLVGALGLAACADFQRGAPPAAGEPEPAAGDDGGPGPGATVFAGAVHDTLLQGCQSCHAAGQAASNTAWLLTGDVEADYLATLPFIDESAPLQSRLLAKASGRGHAGGGVFPADSAELDLLIQWIVDGAMP